MALKPSIEKALNDQIRWEFYSSYLYLSMSSWYESRSLRGFANWEYVQAQEERDHAIKIYQYVISRGGRVKLQPVEAPPFEWKSPLEAFEMALEHEQKVTSLINELVNLAIKEKDHATNNMLQWFVDEQIEEESDAGQIVEQLKMIEKDGGGSGLLYMLDKELATRVYTPLTATTPPASQ
ncbi:ferritin [Methanomicrobium sp. W14]|uniref:ferritin n=1 Tax=Methanomicrobium sp. W14 TaxID=2817839 RepID=UPI001AE4D9C5|nr:ferritin [Methanomicrobium sp. W14]MBP2132811.1 ferritin [Methanomicrobium sp. W14]